MFNSQPEAASAVDAFADHTTEGAVMLWLALQTQDSDDRPPWEDHFAIEHSQHMYTHYKM